jgi:single-stranded-DNA-specific exonuclease
MKLNNLHPLLQHIYVARGVASVHDLNYKLDQLLSYETLLNIDKAVACLFQALEYQEQVLIIGDFDVDGATSTVLAIKALRAFGFKNVAYLAPNRFTYGYGLTPGIIQMAAQLHVRPNLIITVDNGISSNEGVLVAKNLGIKVLITDHHIPGNELPDADAIVNPNQKNDNFPSKHLAGVGVIFYTLLALRSKLRSLNWFASNSIPEPKMTQFLDLVALGTVADVVTLDKNNRILVQQGINQIRRGKGNIGIKALLDIAKKDYTKVIASDLAYALAPRLNAAGRLEDISLGIECLLTNDYGKALNIALKLDTLNQERKAIEAGMQQQATDFLTNLQLTTNLPSGICIFDVAWHQGVVGILASRIKEQFDRPVIAFAKISDNELKGSGRSINGINIRDVLDLIAAKNPGLITKFGGHAMAAGISVQLDKYQDFCVAFDQEIVKQGNVEELVKLGDGELAKEYFNLETALLLRDAGPWGHGFPEPLFAGEFKVVEQRLIGDKHLKMTLAYDDNLPTIDAVFFNYDTKVLIKDNVYATFRLSVNEYRGFCTVQLIVEDLIEKQLVTTS